MDFKVFKDEFIGEIRIIIPKDEPMFCLNDYDNRIKKENGSLHFSNYPTLLLFLGRDFYYNKKYILYFKEQIEKFCIENYGFALDVNSSYKKIEIQEQLLVHDDDKKEFDTVHQFKHGEFCISGWDGVYKKYAWGKISSNKPNVKSFIIKVFNKCMRYLSIKL